MIGYTRANIRALVSAVVPRTPEMAETHGEAHVPGALDIDLDDYVIDSFNEYQEHHLGPVSVLLRTVGIRNYPYAIVVALLLDIVAIELLIRRNNEQPIERWSVQSPFARLAERDRLRALELLETGALDSLASLVDEQLPVVGTVRFLTLGVTAFPLLGYYSEWHSDDPESNPGWQQARYPGPSEGYSELMGYEVESFSDDWPTTEREHERDQNRWQPDAFDDWPPDDFGDRYTEESDD